MRELNKALTLTNNGYRGSDGGRGGDGGNGVNWGQHGGHGGRGQKGERGGNGKPIDASLSILDGGILVNYLLHNGENSIKGSDLLELGNPITELQISVRGGDGGTGGRGGNGGHGADGYPGQNATQYSSGTDGGPGGDGGDGGDGGEGGDSGNGGSVHLALHQVDMDLMMILKQRIPDINPGTPGEGGVPGNGGNGGHGGCGGSSYTWTTTTTVNTENGSQTQTHYHSNPGGFSGRGGSGGAAGAFGQAGNFGAVGDFTINLTTTEGSLSYYVAPYDLEVSQIQFIDTIGYNVIEPGSDVKLMVLHKNIAPMDVGCPTPSHQAIMAFLANNEWVYCDVSSRVEIKRWILGGESVYLPRDILFSIKDIRQNPYKLPREPFSVLSTMDHECLVERVNQTFANVSKTKSPFTIEYPAKESLIKGLSCVTLFDESPIVYSIWNKSQLGIGQKIREFEMQNTGIAKSPDRVLFTTLKINLETRGGDSFINPNDFIIHDIYGNKYNEPHNGLFADVPAIEANHLKCFATTFQFCNKATKLYTRILVESFLYLGHIKNMADAQLIQSRPFEIQLTEGYNSSDFSSQFLLVTNNQSEFNEVTQWRINANALSTTLNTWNLNLYQDLDLSHTKLDGRSLLQDFRGKTMIYINNQYVQDEVLFHATQFIKPRELFNAAKFHGLNSLIIGKQFNITQELMPLNNFERVYSVFFKDYKQFLHNLKYKIPTGLGASQSLPATSALVSPQGDDVAMYLHIDKKPRYIVFFRRVLTFAIYKTHLCSYPKEKHHIQSITVGEMIENTFALTINKKIFKFDIKKVDLKKKPSQNTQELFGILHNSIRSSVVPLSTLSSIGAGGPRTSAGLRASTGLRSSVGPIAIDNSSSTFSSWLHVKKSVKSTFSKRFFELDSDKMILTQYNDSKKGSSNMVTYDLSRYSLTRGNHYGYETSNIDHIFHIIAPEIQLTFKVDDLEIYSSWITRLSPESIEYPNNFSDQSSNVREQIINGKADARGIHLSPRSPILEERAIPTITITKKLIFAKPKEKHLIKEAKKLSEKLNSRFPNQRNIVKYDYNPYKLKGSIKNLGTLEIHRSLDKTSPHIVQVLKNTDQDIRDPDQIAHYSTFYNLMKSMDFRNKLSHLDKLFASVPEPQEEVLSHIAKLSHIGMLILAIVSDITEEQYHFRDASKWRDKLSVLKIKHNLNTLNIFKRFKFEFRSTKLFNQVMSELNCHIGIVLKKFQKTSDTLLPRRRGTDVTNATTTLWQEIMDVHLCDYQLVNDKPTFKKGISSDRAKVMDKIKKLLDKQEKAWKSFALGNSLEWGYNKKKSDNDLVIKAYRSPPFSGALVDSMVKISGVMSKSEFGTHYIPPVAIGKVVEERTCFTDNATRKAFVNNIQIKDLGCLPEKVDSTLLQVVEQPPPPLPPTDTFIPFVDEKTIFITPDPILTLDSSVHTTTFEAKDSLN
ncbi:hypothetical protein CYY_004230 [Polysphondylium violaceum]|uniref:PH domain-containing protein n=1 Tax=Polysphondylium violaceum TaxID=133409 RepID=A0A8J4PTL6_9MYCE|nr:hypothetical protein CYY_004230 [Polysphondylium violaceum]